MTINVFSSLFTVPGTPNWFVITSDNKTSDGTTNDQADDVYVQQVATFPEDLLIADNSSFNKNDNWHDLNSFHADNTTWNGIGVYAQMYATNGTAVSASAEPTDVSNGTRSLFVLSQKIPDKDSRAKGVIGAVRGTVVYADNVWSFNNGGAGSALTFNLTSQGSTSDPSLIKPSGSIVDTDGGAAGNVSAVSISWSAPAVASSVGGAPFVSSITYEIVAATATTPATTLTEGYLRNAAGSDCVVQLPVTPVNPGGIVPGTLSGSLTVDGSPTFIAFQMSSLFPQVNKLNSLAFGQALTGKVTVNAGTPNVKVIDVTGEVDYNSGQIFLHFKEGGKAINPGAVSLTSNYAVYNQAASPSSFTFAPGQTFEKQLYVDLLTPGSTIAVNSPIVQTTGAANGEVFLRATNIDLNAAVQAGRNLDIGSTDATRVNAINRDVISQKASASAIVNSLGSVAAIGLAPGQGGHGYDDRPDGFDVQVVGGGGQGAVAKAFSKNGAIYKIDVTVGGSGYTSLPTVIIPAPQAVDAAGDPRLLEPPTAYTEQLNFNAQVSAPAYDIRVKDDPSTLAIQRGRMFVSSTGSLTAQGNGVSGALYVQADTSDVYVEGTINAARQSYLFRSPGVPGATAPYVFSTTSPNTGASTGLIQGGTVAITLGNDLKTTEQLSVALNTVDLRTYVDSLRVRAATRLGDSINGPFPYDLTVNQIQDASHPTKKITFDAVAASGRNISLTAAGDIGFTAALATWGNLSIAAGSNFDITAPLSTVRGQVDITANAISVNNSLRVLAPVPDSDRDDITLTTKGGDLNLTGAVSAVNNVRLVQRNKAGQNGRISGPARVVANRISVEAEGSASLRTDTVTLSGTAAGDFTVDELNDINVTSLRSAGLVTLRAGGVDAGDANVFTPNKIALQATLHDVTALDVAAPRGSVFVTTDSSRTLTVGNAAAVAQGAATSMQAAGSVTIRSLAGPVIVTDAPIGGGSATTVRLLSAENVAGTYLQNTPGLLASTLTGDRSRLQIDGVPLSVGDRILLANQTNENENGVYVVTVSGSVGRNWILTRAPDADTSDELVSGGCVRVLEGSYANAAYTGSYMPTAGSSLLAVSTVPNTAGAEAVRVATTSALTGSYDPVLATISGSGVLPLIDSVSLSAGDRVLVRLGTLDFPAGGAVTTVPVSAANGVFEVVSVGAAGGTWTLARAANIDTGSAIETGTVYTTEGSYRAVMTGQAFAVSYDSLGVDPLIFRPLAAGELKTDIGTEDINDTTTFVVSSTAGSNAAAGSLGKMIALRQSLDVSASQLNSSPKVAFAFSRNLPGLNGSAAGVIRLTQELPAISKAFALDGANRVQLAGVSGGTSATISIDGSRITTTRLGQPAAGAAEVNGLEFVAGSQSAPDVAGASVSSLTIGGFAKGAAVKMSGVNGILVDKAVLGRNEAGDRLANKFGVRVTGAGAEGTVSGTTIVGSTQAGIRVEPGATGLSIVGTIVGALNQGNLNGIELAGGATSVGIDPVNTATMAIMTIQNQSVFNLPATLSPRSLFIGQGVSGPGIASGTTIAAINGASVTLSKKMTATAVTKGISFGQPARNTVQYNLNGIVLTGGGNLVTNTTVSNNVYSGVVVQGGSQQIGTGRKTSSVSNAIHSNGRYGVEASAAAPLVIIGNNFGVQGRNQLGNVDPRVANARLYVPNARTRVDANGNFHAVAAVAATASRKPAWR